MSGISATQQGAERRSYLLRLHSRTEHPFAWRASLQDVRSGEWRHFADLEQLFAFLAAEEPPDSALGEGGQPR
jgi:hypothetical protein